MVHFFWQASRTSPHSPAWALGQISEIDVHFEVIRVLLSQQQRQTKTKRAVKEIHFNKNPNETTSKQIHTYIMKYTLNKTLTVCQISHQVQMNWISTILLLLLLVLVLLFLRVKISLCVKSFPLQWIVQSADFLLLLLLLPLFFLLRSAHNFWIHKILFYGLAINVA